MTTKEFNSYLDGYLNGISVLDKDMSLKLLTHINPRPDKMRDMDDNSYIHYMRGILTALTQNKDLDPVLLSHLNHLLEVTNKVEICSKLTIGNTDTKDYWNKYKKDFTPPYYWDKDTIPLKNNPIVIRYYDSFLNEK